jgi:hypothetical protein
MVTVRRRDTPALPCFRAIIRRYLQHLDVSAREE